MLKSVSRYNEIIGGSVIPDQKFGLRNFGKIPLVTISDTAFPRFSWLLNSNNENITDKQQKYFNKNFFGARVITENAYGMLKGRLRILLKRTEFRLFNLRYITIECSQYVHMYFVSMENEMGTSCYRSRPYQEAHKVLRRHSRM